jgi:hypothetical protein
MKVKKETLQVNSNAIATITYSFENKALKVEFNNKTKYRYSNVQNEVFFALKHAESIGKYFNKAIRFNYLFKRLA